MKPRRILLIVLVALGGLLLLLPSTLAIMLASSETGLRVITDQLNSRAFGRVRIHVEGARGTLSQGFTADRLTVDNPWVHLEFNDLSGEIELLPLLWQTISMPRAHVRTALVKVLPAPPGNGNAKPRIRFMPGTLSVRANSLAIDSGSLVLASGSRFDATAAEIATVVRSREIRVLSGGLALPNLRIQASGRLLAGWPLGLNGKARLNIHADDQPDWIVNGEFDGDLDELPLTAQIATPFRAAIQGQATSLTTGWRFSGAAAVEDFDIAAWGGGKALGPISGKLSVGASREGYTAQGDLTPAGLAVGPFASDLKVTYADRRVGIERATFVHKSSGARATARGAVFVESEGGPRIALTGDWQQFRWPLIGEDVASRSARGNFTLQGKRPWAVSAEGEIAAADFPSMPMRMRGVLGGDRLDISEAQVDAFGGLSRLRGNVVWSPRESWKLEGDVRGLDPAQLRADLPGRLDFRLSAEGRGFGDAGELDVAISDLAGQLRGAAARGSGTARRTGPSDARIWQFDSVSLHAGSTDLSLDGSTASPRRLRFDLASGDLSLFSRELKGRARVQGVWSGDDAHPALRLQASATNVEHEDDALQRLQADLDIDLADGGRTRGTVHAQGVLYGGRGIEDIKGDLSGTASANTLGVNIKAHPLDIAFRARGAYASSRWRGLIDSFDIRDADNIDLHLTEFAPLTVSASNQSLGRACLEGGDARLCLRADRESASWQAGLDAQNLPLRALTAGLSQSTRYEGRVGMELSAQGGEAREPDVRVAARLNDALLLHRDASGREERVRLGTGSVDGALAGGSYNLRVGLDAGDSGKLSGHVEGSRTPAPWPQWPVTGSVELATDALGIVDLLLTDVDRAAGRLEAHFDVSGSLGEPRLAGALQVRGGELDFYQVNLGIRALDFDARLEDRSLLLSGSLRAGAGTAKVDGRIAWNGGEPRGQIGLRGERLRLIDVPEARVEASPNLTVTMKGRRIEVTGEVEVPEAHFEPADLTNAVLPSGDEVLVGAPPANPERQFQVVSNIRLTLGEKVTINTYGLSGRLTGSINTRSDEADVSRASGELSVAEGKYAAFGRNLEIERGRLLFNNGLVADPGIDLRAQKVYPDITAGVNVRGTLRAPRMTFFSEPAIPQSQIASLILAGGSLQTVQSGGRANSARNDILAQGGAILAQQFGNRVGIEDVSIESDLANETSLVLGRYLSPGLYVSYGISLAEAINIVKLRYTIGDHWTLKTESGRARSADIVYTIRK